MSFNCQKTLCTFSRRLVRRFGHTPSVTVMRRPNPRRIVPRSAGVCSVGVCRGFSGLEKGKRKVQGVPQSQTAALPRPQEEEETDKSKQAQTEQTYEKH